MKIIKRNGSEETFDIQKIVVAVTKADKDNGERTLTDSQIEDIAEYVEFKCNKLNRAVSVEEIQDMVENQIMSTGAFDVARGYVRYRYKRSLVRKANTTDTRILSLIEYNNEEVKQENSNKNPAVNSVQRDYMAGEVSKDITRRLLLPTEIVEADEQGIIHFHDSDYYAQHMHNCDLVNLEDMLQNGTVISETLIEKPHSFSTACNIATQIIAQVASSQYGGQSVDIRHLGKYLRKSHDKYEKAYNVKYDITFSEQKPSTDTIAVNPDDTPFRNADGSLLFRPGGHGALIENLNEIPADVVFIKNIDNVVPDRLKADTVIYKQVIAGVLVSLQKKAFEYLLLLDEGTYNHEKLEEIIRFVQRDLCCRKADIKELEDAELVIYLRKKLNRPMRVCGVVKNVGEPGGGPFLTYNQDGTVSLQILESSQIDKNNEEYMKMFTEGTHFNPVDLVCATKDYQGNAFDLPKFVDPSTGFISSKSKNGKDLKALELPGLWNGAMSDWNTVFVEVPLGTFNPVKTVNDLLRDQHQAVEGGIKHEHHHEHGEGGCCGKH